MTRYLFFLAFAPLSLNQFRNVLVVVSDPPHDHFAFFVLEALCNADNFLGVEAPVLGVVSEIGGHGACHSEIGSGRVVRSRSEVKVRADQQNRTVRTITGGPITLLKSIPLSGHLPCAGSNSLHGAVRTLKHGAS